MSDIPADLDSRGSQAGALAGSQASQATGSSGGEGSSDRHGLVIHSCTYVHYITLLQILIHINVLT